MLIKLYTRGAVSHVHIIENVSRVNYSRSLELPDSKRIPTVMDQSFEHLDMSDEKYVWLKFTDNVTGLLQGLRVYNYAYICSDDGKTVDKVSVIDFYDNISSSEKED